MTATVVQQRTGTRLIQQLALYSQKQLTGQLEVRSPNGKQWTLYFCVGRPIWATHSAHPVRDLRRQLARFAPAIDFDTLVMRESDRFFCWNYQVLWVMVQRGRLDKNIASDIVENTVREIVFDILLHERRHRLTFQASERETLTMLRSQIVALNLKALLKRAKASLDEWKAAGLIAVSPNLVPLIQDAEALQANTPPKVFKQLSKKLTGQQTLRELATATGLDLTRLTRSLVPYLKQGWIDLIEPQEIERPKAAPPAKPASQEQRGDSKPLIACVDDSPQVCEQLGEMLREAGYDFVGITDSVQALPILLEKRPQLIFLDLVMPVANGYEVCTQLRRISQFQDIPIVILTGNDGVVDRVRAKMVKASEFLSKPIDTAKVLATLTKFVPTPA